MLIAEIKIETTIRIDTGTVHSALISNLSEQSEELDTTNWQISTLAHWQISTLKGSNFRTKNDTTTIHTLDGVEFLKKTTVGAGHALRLQRFWGSHLRLRRANRDKLASRRVGSATADEHWHIGTLAH